MSKYSPMNPEIKAKWLEALRSGEYEQGQGALRRDPGPLHNKPRYCCLGVLCEVAGLTYIGSSGGLGDEACAVAGFGPRYDSPNAYTLHGELWNMNDTQRKSFAQIADWIEENL